MIQKLYDEMRAAQNKYRSSVQKCLAFLLDGTDENKPLNVNIKIESEDEIGSMLDMGEIVHVWMSPIDKIIYFEFSDMPSPVEFDSMADSELLQIVNYFGKKNDN